MILLGGVLAIYGFALNKNYAKIGGVALIVVGGVVYAVSESHFGEKLEGVIGA